MPLLPSMNLSEPLVAAFVSLLSSNLNGNIDALNTALGTDPYKLDHVAQVLNYIPVPSIVAGGLPAVGVGRLRGEFQNDLQFNVDAVHHLGIMCIVQNSDQGALSHQLERLLQCVAYTIQQDRLAGTPMGTASVIKQQAAAWSVNFEGYDPGPMLGEADPNTPDGPPRSFLSWDILILNAERTEV